jgi:hypothetical protein
MSGIKLIRARYDQGLAAYRAGHGIDHVIDISAEIDALHQTADLSNEQHREIDNAVPSFISGFLSGLIDDVRRMAATTRGSRA